MSFATAADMTVRYTESDLRDLCTDTGTPWEGPLQNAPRLTMALDSAAGEVIAAVFCARQYSIDDLNGLTGPSLELLKSINCDLAWLRLIAARSDRYSGEHAKGLREYVDQYLQLLKDGERIFQVDAVQDAQLPHVDGLGALGYQHLNLLPDRTRRFYPSRVTRLPNGREGY